MGAGLLYNVARRDLRSGWVARCGAEELSATSRDGLQRCVRFDQVGIVDCRPFSAGRFSAELRTTDERDSGSNQCRYCSSLFFRNWLNGFVAAGWSKLTTFTDLLSQHSVMLTFVCPDVEPEPDRLFLLNPSLRGVGGCLCRAAEIIKAGQPSCLDRCPVEQREYPCFERPVEAGLLQGSFFFESSLSCRLPC
ncbi:hypothetical protein AB1L42_15550 [Thalassoglobus sp. JC818]|uniref:hypothetical protein n=1 Tax=Thalassoglobus sp. JC818 TaxID=3232136 RepID=UPI003458B9F2